MSKTLSPALRLGWCVVPPRLLDAVAEERRQTDLGSPTLDQLALAAFLVRGEYDRHLRRSRSTYRRRRDTFAAALREHVPAARISGVAAGLHLVLALDGDEAAVVAAAHEAGIALGAMADHAIAAPREPALVLGYARASEPALRAAARATAGAIARGSAGCPT